jgi:hypothetical protein
MPSRPLVFRRTSVGIALTTWLVSVAGSSLLGCSKGGAPDGWAVEQGDMRGVDGGLPDGKPSSFDLSRPPVRTQVDFASPVSYPADVLGFSITTARFNNDSIPDILVGGQTQVTVYLNRGDGTFETRPVLLGFGASGQLCGEDLNGDGLGDLALPVPTGRNVAVALGKGDGSFGSPIFNLMGIQPEGVVAVQLNGDTALDLVVTDLDKGQLRVLINKGDGTFNSGGAFAAGNMATVWPLRLQRGELNRDGKMDLLVVQNAEGGVAFLPGNGDGTLQMFRSVGSIATPISADVGDVNLDGSPDVAAISDSEPLIRVFVNGGNGTFSAVAPLNLGLNSGFGMHIGDLNGDGVPDIVGVSTNGTGARVFIGKGDGTFLAERVFPGIGSNPFDVAIADFNADGLNDLVLSDGTNRTISVLLNTTKP